MPPHNVKCFPEYLRVPGYYCTNNDKTDYQFKRADPRMGRDWGDGPLAQPARPYLLWNDYRNQHPIMQEMWRLHAENARKARAR